MNSDEFCLKWNDFQTNIISSYKDLREDQEFADVTLVCGDNQRIEAHKMILSGASNFFRSVLSGNKHPHPLIFMRNVKIKELTNIVDFIYHGEVFIHQEDLNDFLEFAGELDIRGLAENYKKEPENITPQLRVKVNKIKDNIRGLFNENAIYPVIEEKVEFSEDKPTLSNTKTVSLLKGSFVSEAKFSTSFKEENTELNDLVNSMLTKTDGLWTCAKCGKTQTDKYKAKRHIEIHIEGVSHPCGFCGKNLRSRNCLQAHISRIHQNN